MNIVELKQPELSREDCISILNTAGFSRIADKIELLWGSEFFDTYMNTLIISDRVDRAGFPQDVLQSLLVLSSYHTQEFGDVLISPSR